ncbi:MAG TPA: hypothetical protein VKX40_04280 [Aequorivita sp.]|nr:hypothetical protein [Aequorivita sp.]
MKNFYTQKAGAHIAFCAIFFFSFTSFAQVGINTTDPHPSSMLEIKSDDKGILIPRISKNDREAIADPAYGLMVYDTDSQSFWYYKKGSAAAPYIDRWEEIGKNSLKTIVHYQNPNGLTFDGYITTTFRVLSFPNKIIDRNNEFNTSTSTFTAKQDGFYSIYVHVTYANSYLGTPEFYSLGIFKILGTNGAISMLVESIQRPPAPRPSIIGHAHKTQIIAELKEGDKISFGLYDLQNFAVPTASPRGAQTQFTIHQIE